MFQGAKGQSLRPVKRSDSSDNSVTILTSGCHFSGKLYCKGSTRIGGIIEGEIVSEGALIIEQRAHIRANIVAEEVIIHGVVEGRLDAKQRIELTHTGRFIGDIVTPSLTIQEGAMFRGRSIMNFSEADNSNEEPNDFLTSDFQSGQKVAHAADPEVVVM